jgi:hypothetical protein
MAVRLFWPLQELELNAREHKSRGPDEAVVQDGLGGIIL